MMNKNFNIFEQHAEKITLAIAVAAAAYMTWLSTQPLTTGDGTRLEDSEAKVTAAVRTLQTAEIETGKLKLEVPANLGAVPAAANKMPPDIVAFAVPQFVPRQAPVLDIKISTDLVGTGYVLTPTIGKPEDLAVAPWSGQAGVVGDVAGPAGAVQLQLQDIDMVVVSGRLPIAAFVKAMESVAEIKDRLPVEKQISVVYRIEVQRRVKIGSGWGSWVTVPPAPGLPEIKWPSDVTKIEQRQMDADIATVREAFQRIAEPLSYVTPDGKQVLLQVLTGPAKTTLESIVAKGGGGAMPMPMPMPAPAPAMPPQFPPVDGAGFQPPNPPQPLAGGGVPAPAAGVVPAATQPANNDPPFWVVERRTDGPDGLQPNHEYQYQARIVMINPTYNYSLDVVTPGKLKDEKMRNQPFLYSPWEMAKTTVHLQGDMYVFITDATIRPPETSKVGAHVFKRMGGVWLSDIGSNNFVGSQLTGKVRAPDGKFHEVSTGYTIVDAEGEGNKVKVTLMNSSGELVVRASEVDRVDPLKIQLEKLVVRPVTTRPKTATGATPVPGTGTMPPPISTPPGVPPLPPSRIPPQGDPSGMNPPPPPPTDPREFQPR